MSFIWLAVGILTLSIIGEEEEGQMVFFKSGLTFAEGPTLKAGEIAVAVRIPEDGATVQVRTDEGIVFDADTQLISFIPPMQLGDRVEMYPHGTDIPKEQQKFLKKTGVISSIYDNKAEIQFFAHPYPVSIPLYQLVPECYGRGQRDYESPNSVCSCSPSWSGVHCLAPATKTDDSMFAKLRNFLIGSSDSGKDSDSKDDSQSPSPENVTEVLWNGYLYSGIIEVNAVNIKDVLRSASFTIVLACAIWEPSCGVALDMLSESNISGIVEAEEHRKIKRTRNECIADDAIQLSGPVKVRRAWMDTSYLDAVSNGPWTTVFKGKALYGYYSGSIDNPEALSQYMEKAMSDESIITTTTQLERVLLNSQVIVMFSTEYSKLFSGATKPLFFETIENPDEMLIKPTFNDIGLNVVYPDSEDDDCTFNAVILIRGGRHSKHFLRYCYPRGSEATKNSIWRWVSERAVPLVQELSPSNFEVETKFSLHHSTTMIVLPDFKELSLEIFEKKVFEAQSHTFSNSLRYYTLGCSRSREFSRRFAHSKFIALMPFGDLQGYLDIFPSSAKSALANLKTIPPVNAYSDVIDSTGDKFGIRTFSARAMAGLPLTGCQISKLPPTRYHQNYEQTLFKKILLIVRTSWCWHCRAMLPTVEELARVVTNNSGLVVAQHVVDEGIPTWIDRHIDGYPEILVLDFTSSCVKPSITKFQGDNELPSNYKDRSTTSVLQFALSSREHSLLPKTDEDRRKSERVFRLRQKGREAARRHLNLNSKNENEDT